ncbi:DMT family transporter [Phaeobacter piscinae]|uniref:DMT family transporter n=1 Tax=Phaeobacter piscinae TaxID=1580596 RepID=UPI001FD40718|nr:DMT family transporter [Phaeobacter piscinae]
MQRPGVPRKYRVKRGAVQACRSKFRRNYRQKAAEGGAQGNDAVSRWLPKEHNTETLCITQPLVAFLLWWRSAFDMSFVMRSQNTHLQGIGLRLLAAFLMTAMSAAIHGAAQSVPIGQIMFWRSVLALIPIVLYMIWRGEFPAALKTRYPRLHVTRSAFGAFSMAMSFVSLAYLPVANAQALAYLAPVLVLPLSAILLGERLTAAIIIAISFGFAGVVLLLWEAMELPGDGALIGVVAGLAYAVTMAFVRVHTKTMMATEGSSSIAFYFAIVSAALGLASLPLGWVSLSAEMFGWLAFAGLIGGVGHIVANEAVARAPVSTLAPFDYTGLVWALGFDLVLFSVVPGALGVLGVFAIILAALLVTFTGRSKLPDPLKTQAHIR